MEISSLQSASVLAAAVTQGPARTREDITESRFLIRAVQKVNEAGILGDNNELTLAVDRETRRTIVRIVNKDTHEVVRQIPPEYVLRMAEELRAESK